MRNRLVVDLALAGPNVVPDPVGLDSSTQEPLPLRFLREVDEQPADCPPNGSILALRLDEYR
jgi:hypothetical protein